MLSPENILTAHLKLMERQNIWAMEIVEIEFANEWSLMRLKSSLRTE